MALYLEHFGLNEAPFRITPHTDFFFDGADRGATLDALVYAVLHDEGIVKVSGEVGSGKTMLCRVLMERLPGHVDTLYLASPSLGRDEILHAIGDELDLALSGQRTSVALREVQVRLIERYGQGRRVVVLIDEAHVMPDDTLEQVRLLSNLEASRHKLLQIVLFGQPELDATLAKPSLRQLRDRITHSFRMRPLAAAEVSRYLSFRMRAAGYRGPEVFTRPAVESLARAAAGLTRRINILADKALLAAFTENVHAVKRRHVGVAIRDSEFARARRGAPRPFLPVAGAALAVGLAAGAAVYGTLLDTPFLPVHPVELAATPQAAFAPPRSRLSREQESRFAGYGAEGQRLLTQRLTATRELLSSADDERYAVELFVTDKTDPARMERFLLRAREYVPIEELFVIPLAGPGAYRLRVVYGQFADREAAAAAGKRLPPRYQQAFDLALRSFAELRSEI